MKLKELLEDATDIDTLQRLNQATTVMRGPETISTIKELLATGKVTDDIVKKLLTTTSSINSVVQKLSIAGFKFSKELQQIAIDRNPFNISYIKDPNPEVLKHALASNEFITGWPETYDDTVKRVFKDNALLMNKWLRYAKNVRGE